jgi:hypothetical protein
MQSRIDERHSRFSLDDIDEIIDDFGSVPPLPGIFFPESGYGVEDIHKVMDPVFRFQHTPLDHHDPVPVLSG